MRLLSRALRVALPTTVVLAVVAAGTGTAAAQEAGPGIVARANMAMYVGPGYVKFCVQGEMASWSQITGEWTLEIVGHRDATLYTGSGWRSAARIVDYCEPVYQLGSNYGNVVAHFRFTGVGSYVIADSVGGFTWNPSTGTNSWSVEPTP